MEFCGRNKLQIPHPATHRAVGLSCVCVNAMGCCSIRFSFYLDSFRMFHKTGDDFKLKQKILSINRNVGWSACRHQETKIALMYIKKNGIQNIQMLIWKYIHKKVRFDQLIFRRAHERRTKRFRWRWDRKDGEGAKQKRTVSENIKISSRHCETGDLLLKTMWSRH